MWLLRKKYNEKQVLQGIWAENKLILSHVFDELIPVVRRVCHSRMRIYNNEDVRDITSNTLEIFIKKVLLNEYPGTDFRAYCGGIAKNVIKKKKEDKDAIIGYDHINIFYNYKDIHELIEQDEISAIEWKIVYSSFKQLTEDCQEIIKLTDFCDAKISLSYKEVGKLIGKTENNARQFKYSCLAKLRSLVNKKLINLN